MVNLANDHLEPERNKLMKTLKKGYMDIILTK